MNLAHLMRFQQMPSLYVAVPTHSRTISVPTAITLLNLKSAIGTKWKVLISFHSSSVISDLRNVIVANFLNSSADALLMIDSDQGISQSCVVRMVNSPYEVVGAFYPRRNYFWDRLSVGEIPKNDREIIQKVMRYVGNPQVEPNGQVLIQNGFVRATGIGGGAMMIRRQVIEKMKGTFPELAGMGFASEDEYQSLADHNWGFFNPIIEPSQKLHLGEDISFCKRWREGCGGEIWADVSSTLEHVGLVTFRGNWLEYVETNQRNLY